MKTMEEMLLEAIEQVNKTHAISFVALAEDGKLTDDQAIEHSDFFEEWSYPVYYKEGQIRRWGVNQNGEPQLYKVRPGQSHTSQVDWTPDVAKTLWMAIDHSHAGTIEDPIPAVASMEYVKGLYYIENGVIYLMNREGMADGESIVLDFTPSQLVGHYFMVVEV